MRFITITLIVHAPDPRTGEQKSTQQRFREASLQLFQSDIAPVLRREIPDPPWGWGSGPIGYDAVPARAVAATG
jgi:hypothetical protein